MTIPWKLHLIAFWVAMAAVGIAALALGWNATSGLTDEESSYLLYEPAFLILMVVLGVMLVLGSQQMGKIERRMGEIEDEIVIWAVENGWKNPVMNDELKDWMADAMDMRELLNEHDLLSESKCNAWKKLLGPALQLIFLLTITSAAVPSAYWFLRVNPNMNVMTAIVVLGGSIVAILYALSALALIYPKVKPQSRDSSQRAA